MKHMKLSTQINIVFTVVTLLTSLVFLFALSRVFSEVREQQNIVQLEVFYDEVKLQGSTAKSEYNGYVVYQNGILYYASANFSDVLNNKFTISSLYQYYLRTWKPSDFAIEHNISIKDAFDVRLDKVNYHFIVETTQSRVMIVFTGNDYLSAINNQFTSLLQISFVALILLGNLIILTWSRLTVERVKKLQNEVGQLVSNNYQVPIEVVGTDEITDLARTIEKMRREIESTEKIKKEMLQNISHDFKTPIAVIRSYAEAIGDGISDPKETEVIIKQAEILNEKVKQLLEYNKLEYLKDPSEFEMISIKDIILNIVNNQKYRSDVKFELDLDDSKYFGASENFYTIFNNIIDNALRYAQSQIIIRLKNKKLTFFNDGEPISDYFIENMFKPYQKGAKGEFGLGMSIVQKTCEHFNLSLKVKNTDNGVEFTIEPLE